VEKIYALHKNFNIFDNIPSSIYRAVNKIESMGLIYKTWSTRISDRRELANMSDRLLKDIGLTRADVYEEIKKPFWR